VGTEGSCLLGRTEPSIPEKGAQLLFSVSCGCPLENRVHIFLPPKEACFAISPIKYTEISISSIRQKGHLCNPAIFNLLLFCSLKIHPEW